MDVWWRLDDHRVSVQDEETVFEVEHMKMSVLKIKIKLLNLIGAFNFILAQLLEDLLNKPAGSITSTKSKKTSTRRDCFLNFSI